MRERIAFERELEILRGPEKYPDEPVPLREHSEEWKAAYKRTAPENAVQKDLVAQLAVPVLENETKKQAERVTALQILFANTDLQTAKRLFARLTDSKDFLGRLFHLTLHRGTRKYLLSILDAVIVVQSQEQTDKPVQLPKPPIAGVPPIVIPPKIVKRRISRKRSKKHTPPEPPDKEPDKEPKINAPRVPFPWQPKTLILPPPADKSDWVNNSITSAASFLGVAVSIGLRALSKVSLEDAIEAAWIVFQVEEGGLKALYGLAGEAAAEAILKHTLGVDPSRIVNLNTIRTNFPFLDITSPGGFISVKVKGVAGKLVGKALEDAIETAYVNDFYNMLIADHPKANQKLAKAANFLFNNLENLKITRALPDDLKDFTEAGIKKYIQEKALLQIPHDHVQMVKRGLGKKLYARVKNNKKILDSFGIKTDAQLVKFINSQIDRIQSLGVKSTDLMILAETAASQLPPAQVSRLKKDLNKLKAKFYPTK